jgi:hypothetical protein
MIVWAFHLRLMASADLQLAEDLNEVPVKKSSALERNGH